MISTITQKDLDIHAEWVKDHSKGQRLISAIGKITFEANLIGANLSGAKNVPPYVFAVTNILPAGDLIVYKKADCGTREVILLLEIPAAAKRSNASGRKCRAEYAVLRGVDGIGWEYDGSPVTSKYDRAFVYPAVGETITPDGFDDDRWNECSTGVHFFITRYEAEKY